MPSRRLAPAILATVWLLSGCAKDEPAEFTNLSIATPGTVELGSAQALSGDTVTLRATALNSGNTMTAGVIIRAVDLSTGVAYDRVVPPLAIAQTAQVAWTFDGVESPRLSGGSHRFQIIADPTLLLPEPFKSDNVAESPEFTLNDLALTFATAPAATGGVATVASTAPASLTWAIGLSPATAVTSSRMVAWRVIRTRDQKSVAEGVSDVAVGGRVAVTPTWTFVSGDDQAGATDYTVILDPANQYPEFNELDNAATVTITWTVSG
jgi:hypothetical protein